MISEAEISRLTPFRRRVYNAWRKWPHEVPFKSSWMADELHARETNVSNALVWLELNGFIREEETE